MKGELLNPIEFETRPLPKHRRDIAPPEALTRDNLKDETKRVRKEYLHLIHKVKKDAKNKKGRYQWQNEFKRWQDVDKIKPLINTFLERQFGNLLSFEASYGIDRIRAFGYLGIGKNAWMADLKFYQYTNLGDGVVTMNKHTRQWESSQQKKHHTHTSHLRIRKRK